MREIGIRDGNPEPRARCVYEALWSRENIVQQAGMWHRTRWHVRRISWGLLTAGLTDYDCLWRSEGLPSSYIHIGRSAHTKV
jgi:hypothetical protein